MLVVYGSYRWLPKVTAYRSDWCNVCKKEVVSYRYRRLYVGHVFWIPLLPLGLYQTWHCGECRNDPRTRVRTSIGYFVGGIIGFLLLLTLLVFGDVQDLGDKRFWLEALCILGIGGLAFGLRLRLRDPPVTHPVKPLANVKCLVCETMLPAGLEPRCGQCGTTRSV